ncbi:unnamed protein product [Tilletia caries]|nr:unnamed protein product [Tilletia caries]
MLDIEGFRRAGYAAIDAICEYYARLDDLPVQAQVQPGFLMKQIPDSAPEEGEEWSAIDRDFHKIIMPGMTHWQSGMFAAYFPGNATFEGSLADLYASSVSNPGFNWSCSPSCTELELITVDWWAKVLGLDPAFQSNVPGSQGGGIIHGSASEVCITIAIAARERVLAELAKTIPPPTVNGSRSALPASANGMGCDIANELDVSRWRSDLTSRLVLYATTQTHSIAIKAASVLGLSFRALDVQAEDAYALRAHTLKAALDEDKEAGRIPFLLVLTVGTTSSGAVDNITEVVEVAREYPNMWLHIDAAYAGTALALPELRESSHLAAINAHADSFSTNAHKWGLIQLECSPLHVRDRGALTRALTVTPEIACAKLFEIAMRDDENPFEFVAPPRWSLVVFRLNPSRIKGQSLVLDDLNRRFMDRLNARSAELMLTQTVLPEIGVCIRYVVGQPGLREHHVIKAFKIVKECAEETLQAQ